MLRPMETLHTLMTNQFFICAAAIVLFLMVITLVDPAQGEVVIADLWT